MGANALFRHDAGLLDRRDLSEVGIERTSGAQIPIDAASRIPAVRGGAPLIDWLAMATKADYRALVTARRLQIRGEERCAYSFWAPAASAAISVDVSPQGASTSPFWCARDAPRSSRKTDSSC